ncbi:MAG: ABC transporter permease, partial [Litorimonas sp.]
MTWVVLQALSSHWRYRPLQLLTLIAGLALATALWAGVQAVNAEARASYADASDALGQSQRPVIDGPFTAEQYVVLRRSGWRVSPVVEGELIFPDLRIQLTGIDPLTNPQALGGVFLGGDASLADPPLFVAPERIAVLEGVPGLPALRAASELGRFEAATEIGTALDLLGRERIDRLIVLPDQPIGQVPLAEVVPGAVIRQPADDGDVARLTRSFHLNLTAFGLLSFAVGLFIVHAAITLAFEQRRGMVRTLRAIGVPTRTIVVTTLVELVVLAVFSGIVGVLLGYLIAGALLPGVAVTLEGLYGARVDGGLSFRPGWALSGLAIAVAGTLAASAQSLWKIA